MRLRILGIAAIIVTPLCLSSGSVIARTSQAGAASGQRSQGPGVRGRGGRGAGPAAQAKPGALIGCGVGTDHLQISDGITLNEVVRAYEEQIEAIEQMGGKLIVMASRALAKVAKGPDEYAKVYDRILTQVRQPVILHWLGEMFDPALTGYWGATDHMAAMETCLTIVGDHAAKVDGIKVRSDGVHLTPEGVRWLTPWLEESLR